MNRRVRYQKRNVEHGRCRHCPRPIYRAQRCETHYAYDRELRNRRDKERRRFIREIVLVDGRG